MSALRKILVVDDDPVVGKSFDRVLAGKGYIVTTAQDGPEALRRLAEGEYDVVYTDIRMPGMDGLEVAERVKAKRPWVPVVIVTGYGTEANDMRAKAAGVAEILHKPLSPEMIEGSARKALHAVPAVAATAVATEPAGDTAEGERTGWLRAAEAVVLLLAAPLVGLAYVVAAPFVGLAMLAWMGVHALARHGEDIGRYTRQLALMITAPFVGLAYAVAAPFIGLGALVWMGLREAFRRREAIARIVRTAGRHARNVALFFAAPFIGLAYALAFPLIGIGLLIRATRKGDDAR